MSILIDQYVKAIVCHISSGLNSVYVTKFLSHINYISQTMGD